jgi:hypothetical protein
VIQIFAAGSTFGALATEDYGESALLPSCP